jgi:hypothetical protein
MLRRVRMSGLQRVWLGVVRLVPEVSLIGLLLLGVGPDRLWLLVADAVALLRDVGLVELLIHYVGVYRQLLLKLVVVGLLLVRLGVIGLLFDKVVLLLDVDRILLLG